MTSIQICFPLHLTTFKLEENETVMEFESFYQFLLMSITTTWTDTKVFTVQIFL